MSARFHISDTSLQGLCVLQRLPRGDERGYLERMFCDAELHSAGWLGEVKQLNHTYTQKKQTVRGLHYQLPPHAEIKLVSCLRGAIWDVVVDIRRGSPTFLQWHAEILSSDNKCSLLIPQGFAHGFQTLSDDVDMLYCHSAAHVAEAEAGLLVNDPSLAIPWPLPIQGLSARDLSYGLLSTDFKGVVL